MTNSATARPITLARLQQHAAEVEAIAARHGVSNVRVFGSVARGTADDRSDLDLLVERDQRGTSACSCSAPLRVRSRICSASRRRSRPWRLETTHPRSCRSRGCSGMRDDRRTVGRHPRGSRTHRRAGGSRPQTLWRRRGRSAGNGASRGDHWRGVRQRLRRTAAALSRRTVARCRGNAESGHPRLLRYRHRGRVGHC